MTENIGVENSSSIIYYDEDLPVMGAGRFVREIRAYIQHPDIRRETDQRGGRGSMTGKSRVCGLIVGVVLLSSLSVDTCFGLEKEKSLVLDKLFNSAYLSEEFGAYVAEEGETPVYTADQVNVGELAVAGRLDIDLHAEFMVSRTFKNDVALNWYNCGLSGGGNYNEVGGNFGDFGLHVPHTERDEKYPHAVTADGTPAVKFDGNDIMRANFPVEAVAAGSEDMALEVWVHDATPLTGEVILGWQTADGANACAPLTYPKGFRGSGKWRHIVVNCTPDTETWYVDGKKVQSGKRRMVIPAGHRMVLGGLSGSKPSFDGSLAAVRLHEDAMTQEEIAHNYRGGVMLGTEMHSWWRLAGPDMWWSRDSEHFRHSLEVTELEEEWDDEGRRNFFKQCDEMFELAEELYRLYSERHAMRSSVVSFRPELRGDGIKYKTPIQPSAGSWMGLSVELGFGWCCQGSGSINPHELVHGWQEQTGGALGSNYWEAHANFPQTYAGIYQTNPATAVSWVCMFIPASGRSYYHDRLMIEHLAQTPEYGPMFISKLWHDGRSETGERVDPWISFSKFDPDPSTPLAYEWTRMVQRTVTWDYEIYSDNPNDSYAKDAERSHAEMMRYARVMLEKVPYDQDWWRVPKEMSPQQLGYSICPLKIKGDKVSFELAGYVSEKRGGDWRAAFVGVNAEGKPRYGDVVGAGEKLSFDIADSKELYLIVCATPSKIMEIDIWNDDFRSFAQEKFPYKVKLEGCEPLDVLATKRPTTGGAPHSNGGGFVAETAKVDQSAYVGPNAQVLGNSKVLGNARIEDYAVVENSTVRDNAVVSDHALVTGGSIVRDHAKIRDYGRVHSGATIKDFAKVMEHGYQGRRVCGGFAVIKGVAESTGNVRGTAIVDGAYAKSNEVEKGKWFTWSWGSGQTQGEVDEDFYGLYMQMLFENPHEWMARDDFGVTWGYLVGEPEIQEDPASVKYTEMADVVEDAKQFMLPRKPGDAPGKAHRWDNYGSLMSGYLHPPVSGAYTFYVYADDNGVVSLSSDADLENRKVICASEVSGQHNYEAFPTQKSKPIELEKGKVYYIEALFKAAGGGDYMGVAWEYEGQERVIIDGQYLSKTVDGPTGATTHRAWHNMPGDGVDELLNDSRFSRGMKRTSNRMLALNGLNQFVELQDDVADMRDITVNAKVNWQGEGDGRILDFSNEKGDSVYLAPSLDGKCVLAIRKDGKTQAIEGPGLKKGVMTEVMVILSADVGLMFIDGKEVGRNDKMTLNPDDINATECYLGRGRNGNYFKGLIDSLEIYSVAQRDDVPPTPDPACFALNPMFANPNTAFMQAEAGSDPMGNVEYFFEETTGNPGGDDSGWTNDPKYQDTGLEKGKTYTYSVKMRDTGGNVTKPSEPAKTRWKDLEAFKSADGKTFVIEAENYTRSIPGTGSGRGIEWKLLTDREGCAGKGLMDSLPDRGVQIDFGFESKSPRLDYIIDFAEIGKYTIWMRSWGPNVNGDSVHFGLDFKSPDRLKIFHCGNSRLQWMRHRDWSFEIEKPGIHTFSVWMREDGSAFDRLIITKDLGYEPPKGEGPVESRRQ
jgi:hypothetical protein